MKCVLIELTYFILWPSFFSFALKLFRFPLKPFIVQIAFATILLSQMSMLIQLTDLAYFMSILHFSCSLLCVWLIFRIRLLYSVVMVLLAGLVVSVTEYLVNLLIPNSYITFVTEDNMYRFFISSILFVALINLFTVIMHRSRIGFSYLSRSEKAEQLLFVGSPTFKVFLFIAMLMVAFSSLFYFFIPKYLLVIAFVLFILMAVLMRKSYRWEMGK